MIPTDLWTIEESNTMRPSQAEWIADLIIRVGLLLVALGFLAVVGRLVFPR